MTKESCGREIEFVGESKVGSYNNRIVNEENAKYIFLETYLII